MGEPGAASAPLLPRPGTAASAEALVRDFERAHGRQLIDTRLAGWGDLPSEAVLKAFARWRLKIKPTTLPVPPFLSVRNGEPQRFIDIHVISALRPEVRLRQSQLLRAAELGTRGWLYAVVFDAPGGLAPMDGPLQLQDPARAAWTPPTSSHDGAHGADAVWRLPRHVLRHCADVSSPAA